MDEQLWVYLLIGATFHLKQRRRTNRPRLSYAMIMALVWSKQLAVIQGGIRKIWVGAEEIKQKIISNSSRKKISCSYRKVIGLLLLGTY